MHPFAAAVFALTRRTDTQYRHVSDISGFLWFWVSLVMAQCLGVCRFPLGRGR